MEYILKNFGNIRGLFFRPIELPVWKAKPITVKQDKINRSETQVTLRLHDGKLMEASEDFPPTHKIISCNRTMNNQFQLTVISLTGSQEQIITLI